METLAKSDKPYKVPLTPEGMNQPKPSRRHPLGLPAGSIRALLTLLIVSVVTLDMAMNRPPSSLWAEALLVAVAHYFASRRHVPLSLEALTHLGEQGFLEKEDNPLFLPRHTIRVLIFTAFIALGIHLTREGRLLAQDSMALLTIIASFLLGLVVRALVGKAGSRAESKTRSGLADLQAYLTVTVLIISAILHWTNNQALVPRWFDDMALALSLFYFGTR